VLNMARMRRELCFSAGSFTYAELYQNAAKGKNTAARFAEKGQGFL